MSYIIKKTDPLVNLKLTNKGRRNLSNGLLSFINFTLGDGEMDYTSDDPSLINILRPADSQHDVQYPIPSNGTNYRNPITVITSKPIEIHATAKERGFFTYDNKPRPLVEINSSLCLVFNVTGSTASITDKIRLDPIPDTVKNTNYKTTINTGDYLFLKFKISGYTDNHNDEPNDVINTDPILYQMYSIVSVNSGSTYDLSGYTTGTSIEFQVDRSLPAYVSYTVAGFIYPGSNTISDYYDIQNPTAYWQNGMLDFTTGATPSGDDIPVWNMTIITLDDIIGLDSTLYKGKYSNKSKNYWGTAINYDYFINIDKNKIGVIHYTNKSVSNYYAEGFFSNTFKLKIPYLMWHKRQFNGISTGIDNGYTFVCDSTIRYMGANNTIKYYDLVDQEEVPTIVGKVLVDEKIAIIEDQELLIALSHKGNRNYTLPTPQLTAVNPGVCPESSMVGALQPNEAFHVSYLFSDVSGNTGLHCENYATLENNDTTAKDIVFQFNQPPTDYTGVSYSEFSYLMPYTGFTGVGYRTNSISLLWQKTNINSVPAASEWNYYNINNYVGTNGCLYNGGFQTNAEYFGLYSEVIIGTGSVTPVTYIGTDYYTYKTTQTPIGSLFISSGLTSGFAGSVLNSSDTITGIGATNKYYVDTQTTGTTIWFKVSDFVSTTDLMINYVTGTTQTSSLIKQSVVVPSSYSGKTYLDGIYTGGTGAVSLTLNEIPNNNVIWIFYNGQLLNSLYYGVFTTGTTADRRIQLGFLPVAGANITYFYIDAAGLGTAPVNNTMTPLNISNLRVNIDNSFLSLSSGQTYNVNNFISVPSSTNITGMTFGDENFFYGNVETDIHAMVYKTVLTCNVLPNQFINSANPTFNPNDDKASFTEIGIYDNSDDLVAIGKFSQPLVRKYNSDMLIIQATIDF
jgi:hypothetical protein